MVFNDINESNLKFNYDKLSFYFSSDFYKEKFEREYIQFLKDEMMKMKLRYKANIYSDELILLLLYRQIEKRGFRVYYDDKRININYYFNIELDKSSLIK